MENELIRTDKLTYKIRRFFVCLFIKNSRKFQKNKNVEDINLYLNKIISCKTEMEELGIKEEVAQKLMKKELSINDLTDEEIDEMIEYFKKDIQLKDEELVNIKKQIKELKEEFENNNS